MSIFFRDKETWGCGRPQAWPEGRQRSGGCGGVSSRRSLTPDRAGLEPWGRPCRAPSPPLFPFSSSAAGARVPRNSSSSSSSSSLLPPSAHGLLCPVAAAAASLLAPRAAAAARAAPLHLARQLPGPGRASRAPRRAARAPCAAGAAGRQPASAGRAPSRRPPGLGRTGCVRAALALGRPKAAATPVRIWFACIRSQTLARKEQRDSWRTEPGWSWAFSLRALWCFPPGF